MGKNVPAEKSEIRSSNRQEFWQGLVVTQYLFFL